MEGGCVCVFVKFNLLADGAIAVVIQPVEFVRFTQKGVEGFSRAVDGGGIR